MERKSSFDKTEVTFLANLCHDCRDCFYACPYTPPHAFNVNIPEILSEVRLKSYEESTRPKFLSTLFKKQQRFVAVATLLAVILTFSVALSVLGTSFAALHLGQGSFYDIFPYLLIIVSGAFLGAYVVILFVKGVVDFCVSIRGSFWRFFNGRAIRLALIDSLGHRWFRGGGAGCAHESSHPSQVFLIQHALIIYGFLSALLSTISAGVYQDIFGILPPYPIISVPVIFGLSGGVAMIAGATSILYQKGSVDKIPTFRSMFTLDYSFLWMLEAVSATGIATLILRDTAYLGPILALHLGLVLSLFIVAPYGKFIHFLYRFASLVNNRLEEQTKP
jgi:citrate/tricarballylate utilization protein